jgi:FecR protein
VQKRIVRASGDIVVNASIRAGSIFLACAICQLGGAAAQTSSPGCEPDSSINNAQTLRCLGGITIVAENGARYILQDRDGNGRVDSAELSSKALLIEVPKRRGAIRFQVITPQAISAVRGTKWAIEAVENKTSVFVADGTVAVSRPSGGSTVILKRGEGVDVEGTGPLNVKRWAAARVAALMARLGQ